MPAADQIIINRHYTIGYSYYFRQAKFNRGIWKELEGAVRELNAKLDVLETYVICGPIFNFDVPVKPLRTREYTSHTACFL